MNKAKILFIVECKVREKNLLKKITQSMNIKAEIFSVCANIHMLYQKLKEYEFNADITQVLSTLNSVDPQDKEILTNNSFAYTYLIFDTDLQHYDINDENLLSRWLNDIREMIAHFNDETDPTIGKMYVNYPMVESFRDCQSFYDSNYINQKITINELVKYKDIVDKRGIKINLSKYTYENFISLAKLNLHKANYIVNKTFNSLLYSNYLKDLSQTNIFNNQCNEIVSNKTISILNTCLFFIIDYLGNNNNFYDNNFLNNQ